MICSKLYKWLASVLVQAFYDDPLGHKRLAKTGKSSSWHMYIIMQKERVCSVCGPAGKFKVEVVVETSSSASLHTLCLFKRLDTLNELVSNMQLICFSFEASYHCWTLELDFQIRWNVYCCLQCALQAAIPIFESQGNSAVVEDKIRILISQGHIPEQYLVGHNTWIHSN